MIPIGYSKTIHHWWLPNSEIKYSSDSSTPASYLDLKINQYEQRSTKRLSSLRQKCDGAAQPELFERLNSLQARLDRLSGVERSPPVSTNDLVLVNCHPVDSNSISDLEFNNAEQLESEVFYLKVEPLKQRKPYLTESDIEECVQLCTRDRDETIVREVDGKVKIAAPIETIRKYVSHYLHLKDDDGWKSFKGALKKGNVETIIPIPIKALVCVTSRGTECDLTVGPNGTEHRFTSNKDVLIRFPKGAVQTNQVIHVSLESADQSAIQKLKRNEHDLSIVGFTDIVHIEHEEPFKRDICVELPMMMITNDDIAACDLIAIHYDDDNIIIDQKGNKLKKVGKNKIKLETSLFSRKSVGARKKRPKGKTKQSSESKEISTIYGYNLPCSVLLFLGKGPTDDSWMVWIEISPEEFVDYIVHKRVTENRLIEPPNCRSPGKCIKKKARIRVRFSSEGCLKMFVGVPTEQTIVYLPAAKHNYICFPVSKTGTSEMAILEFQLGTKKKRSHLHTAYFQPHEFETLEPENEPAGFFSSQSMLTLVQHVSIDDMLGLATGLGLSLTKYQDLRFIHAHSADDFKMAVVDKWLKSSANDPEKDLTQLTNALANCDINRVAEICKVVFKKGRGLKKSDFK
ncbi:uncharacterized protein LOC132556846 [Ylistrum balloti]|uniref:uncharacterized protein LOC132556846 n=1 Tax=Ylistrum balloti TaxID=509963 RepID=UPI002905E54C|nr:uncharacterized protein LOC132556846 [Ylistrum balloti]